MTVTDPDVPDPANDPRALQADPGAPGQGADLASAGDDDVAAGTDEPDAADPTADPTDDPAGEPDEQLTEQQP